jgi:zinc transport system ATP-binding protein
MRPYVLDNINIEIKNGEYISIVGENGCGKSTLLKLILKFLKPTQGSISSEAKRIGYIPQKSDNINSDFPLTVYEMLNSYRRLLKIKDKSVISQTLDLVGLRASASSLIGTLSGGQSQKALVARALMGNPELLILDEPSTGIDRDSQFELYKLIKKLNIERGMTIISVEHNLEAAIENSTLIFHLSRGRGHFCTPRQFASEYLNIKDKEDRDA